MRLQDNWQKIIKRAWSVRLMLVAATLTGLETVVPFLPAIIDIPAGIFAGLSFLVIVAAFVARFTVQNNMKDSDDEPTS